MSLDPTSAAALGTAIAGAVSGLTPEQKANLVLAWQTICIQLYASLNSDLSGSVDTGDIADGAITTAKIGDNQVTAAKIGDNQVTTAKIGNNQVTTAKLPNGAVTTAKIGDNQVTSAKIADGTIVNADISSSAAIAGSKINPNFGSQTVRSTGPFITGSVNVAVNSSTPSDSLLLLQSGSVYLCTAKFRSGSNTGAVALALISRHSSTSNIYISNLHATVLGFEEHPLFDNEIRLYSTSGSTTTASVSWLRLH